MNIADDVYLGPLPSVFATAAENPTAQLGVGPMGRVSFLNIAPLTLQTGNIGASQHMTASAPLVLTAGTGVTTGLAPNGSSSTIYVLDVPRCVSLSSTSDLHLINFTVSGFDQYSVPMTAKVAGPNNSTVNTLKAFKSVLSIVPDTTDGTHNVTAGTSDIFGLPFYCADAGYVLAKWANTLALNAGTLVTADATSPATSLTGDVRGTYAQSGGASNGTRRLVVWQHLTGGACGASATQAGAYGVTQA